MLILHHFPSLSTLCGYFSVILGISADVKAVICWQTALPMHFVASYTFFLNKKGEERLSCNFNSFPSSITRRDGPVLALCWPN